jgi:hypothetical protein
LIDQMAGLPFQPVSVFPSKICVMPGGTGPNMVLASPMGGLASVALASGEVLPRSKDASVEFPAPPPLPLGPPSSMPAPPAPTSTPPVAPPDEPAAPDVLPPEPVAVTVCVEAPELVETPEELVPDAPAEPELVSWSLPEQPTSSANTATHDRAFWRILEPG